MESDIGIVDVNVPLLQGLKNLCTYKIFVRNIGNTLLYLAPKHEHPIIQKYNQLFYY